MRGFHCNSNAHSVFGFCAICKEEGVLWGRSAFGHCWVNTDCEEYGRWYLIMHLLWISGKCDACCSSWACYLFFSTALFHTHWWVRRRLSEKKNLKSGSPEVFISGIQQSDSVLHREAFQFRPVQSLSRVQLFGTPRTAVHQASLSNIDSQSLLKLMSIESVMPSNHLIFCCPLLLLPSIFPSIRVFSNEP